MAKCLSLCHALFFLTAPFSSLLSSLLFSRTMVEGHSHNCTCTRMYRYMCMSRTHRHTDTEPSKKACFFSPVSLRLAGAELYQVAQMIKRKLGTCCSPPALKLSMGKIKRLFGGPLVQVTSFLFHFVFIKVFFLFRSLFLSPPSRLAHPCVDPNTPTCVHSRRLRVYRHIAHMFWTFSMHTRTYSFSTFFSVRTTHTAHQTHATTTNNTTPQTTPPTPHALLTQHNTTSH